MIDGQEDKGTDKQMCQHIDGKISGKMNGQDKMYKRMKMKGQMKDRQGKKGDG